MKLRIGSKCAKTLDDGRQIVLEIKDIRLSTPPMPVVGLTIERHLDGQIDTLRIIVEQLFEWTSDEGWTVIEE